MVIRRVTMIAVLLVAIAVGVAVGRRHAERSPAPERLTVRQLRIVGADGGARATLGESGEGAAGIWLTDAHGGATVQLGVHGNGFPYLLVSDGAVRSFGLGRVDGVQASPILVFRSDDLVRMVFGLDMVAPERSPFLVGYTADGRKHDVIGHYCDRPDRVCLR